MEITIIKELNIVYVLVNEKYVFTDGYTYNSTFCH